MSEPKRRRPRNPQIVPESKEKAADSALLKRRRKHDGALQGDSSSRQKIKSRFFSKFLKKKARNLSAKNKAPKEEQSIGGFSLEERRRKKKARLPVEKIAIAALSCVLLGSVFHLGAFALRWGKTRQTERELSELHRQVFADDTETPMPTSEPLETPVPTDDFRNQPTDAPPKDIVQSVQYQRMGGTPLEQMEKSHEQNSDLTAWLTIDKALDLPVVYRDNQYYLTHDFYKNQSDAGTIFLDENHPMTERTQNLLLHGHNMKDGTMFGRLTQYEKSVDYLRAHPLIEFSTLWHQENYAIFAVLDVSLDAKSEQYLDFFSHPTFASDTEFKTYVRKAQLLSMYAIPIDVQPSDALLTLSTCLDENRLVILARRQREGERLSSLRAEVQMAVRQ